MSNSHSTFSGNEYHLGNPHSTVYVSGYSGSDNTYSDDRWYTTRPSMTADLSDITDSTYEDCDFYLPNVVTLGSDCTYDGDCYFENGVSGGSEA